MDGVIPMKTCKSSKRSGAVHETCEMALVIAALSLVCTLIITATLLVYGSGFIGELRSQHDILTQEIGKLQSRVARLEFRCKHESNSGIPFNPGEVVDDDALREIPITGTGFAVTSTVRRNRAAPDGDRGQQEKDDNVFKDTEDQSVVKPTTTNNLPWPFNNHKRHKRFGSGRRRQRRDGEQGPQGERGPEGERGRRGERGPQGERGPEGERGRRGRPGVRGEHGHKGDRGPTGECACPIPASDVGPDPVSSSATPGTIPPPSITTSSLQRASIPVAHFEGDISSAVSANEHIDPFNQEFVRLRGGWIPYWRAADWMTPDMMQKFRLERHSGNVTVTEGGIYYVYSQMLYYDPSPIMGHSVYVDGEKTFTCTQCTVNKYCKFNACHIAGLVHIPAGGNVGIKVNYENTMISLQYDSAYFGLMKML